MSQLSAFAGRHHLQSLLQAATTRKDALQAAGERGMEPFFSMLRLRSPARRHFLNADRTEDTGGFSAAGILSAPTSPLARIGANYYLSPELEETSFGEVFAAIPFSWEETPGTPLRTFGSKCCSGGEDGEIDGANFGSLSSSEIRDESSPTDSSDQLSQSFDSELESPIDDDPGSAVLSRERHTVEGKFQLKSDPQQVETSSPIGASPPPTSTPDELFFKWRPVPILRLPPRLQHLEFTSQTSSTPSNDSPSSAADSTSRSAWSSFNKQHFRSPFSRSPARSPARSPYRSESNTKSKPASILTSFFGTTSSSEKDNDGFDPDDVSISADTAKERTGRRLERQSHRSSRSDSPLRRFKRGDRNSPKSQTKYSSFWSFNRDQKRSAISLIWPSITITSPQEVVSRARAQETTSHAGVSTKSKPTQIYKEETKTKKQTAINSRNTNNDSNNSGSPEVGKRGTKLERRWESKLHALLSKTQEIFFMRKQS